jgi:quinol monooxygenase YgiN
VGEESSGSTRASPEWKEDANMAMVALGTKGNFVHVYDFRVKPGTGDEFIRLFDEFDYSDRNPMHKSPAQVKDGILCRDVQDPDHFYLLGEWSDIKVHAEIRKALAETIRPEFVGLIEGGKFVPVYAEIVSSTPQHVLEQAAR